MKIGVIGATGFIGSHVLRPLGARSDHEIIAFTSNDSIHRRGLQLPPDTVIWATLDLTWHQQMLPDFLTVDMLIDCSGLVNVRGPGGQQRFYDFVENQLRWIDLFCQRGCRNVIGLSSGGTIYGNVAKFPICESQPANPISTYGKSKLVYELGLLRLAEIYGLDTCCIFRIANVCGFGQRSVEGFGLIPSVINALLAGQSIIVAGDGSSMRDYIDVADVADAIARATNAKLGHIIMNLGSGVGRSINEVIAELVAICEREPVISHVPAPAEMILHNVLDISFARKLLGWQPRVPFEQSLRNNVMSLRMSTSEEGLVQVP